MKERTIKIAVSCLTLGWAAGCSGLGGETVADEPIGATSEAILNGDLVNDGGGAVWIDFQIGGRCSGALLNATTLVTASHCLNSVSDGGSNGVKAWLTRGGLRECISSANCDTFTPVTVHRDTTYEGPGDPSNDYGVVVLASGAWRGVSVRDYMYIYTDSAKHVLDFDALGYGDTSYDGTGAGTLRQAPRHMTIYHATNFRDDDVTNSHLCNGDSGGPAVARPDAFDSSFTNRVLLGTFSGHHHHSGEAHDVCSEAHDDEFWNRTEYRIPTIENWTGNHCVETSLTDSTGAARTAKRCWNSCSGATQPGVGWQQDDNGVYIEVDTRECEFDETPLYFTSLGGSRHWKTQGATSIYSPTSNGFRVHIMDPENDITADYAATRKWHVNWEGVYKDVRDLDLCSGRTSETDTNWVQYGQDGVYVDVDTSACNFNYVRYLTTIGGAHAHASTKGASSVYATENGFRVYVYKPDITVDRAKSNNWHINWQAVPNYIETSCSNEAGVNWIQYGDNGVYIDVDTSACHASSSPSVLTSLGGGSKHWATMGATSIYGPTESGFRVYVNRSGITVADAIRWDWRVVWKIPAQR